MRAFLNERTEQIYELVNLLTRNNHLTPTHSLPKNGIYLFFEQGEDAMCGARLVNRIVRVGTHTKDGRFRPRIRQHYGNVSSLRGNKNGSVFRKHVGGALLRRDNLADHRLGEWLKQGGQSYLEIEERVSHELRTRFTFCCIEVDDANERKTFERGLVALLAQRPPGNPSDHWLGRYAASEKLVRSGIWNSQRIDAEPLTAAEFQRLTDLAKITIGKGSMFT